MTPDPEIGIGSLPRYRTVWILLIFVAPVLGLVAYDVLQKRHAILRNFPIIGHFRYWLEAVGPELRQYIVTSNDEERPFSRDQRRWVYASAKRANPYFGFGTDNDLELSPNYLIVSHATLPYEPSEPLGEPYAVPCAKILGGRRGRKEAFRPASLVNISAMSFGALSGNAVEALNRGAALGGALQNTGEGGISPYHRHGGDLIWQIGTGYFGCRDDSGRFSLERFREGVASAPVRAVEIKLSQGAKPGLGGVLPAAKVTTEIAAARGVEPGVDCLSPHRHSSFRDADEMLDFVELLASESGLPVGVKSAVGELGFWEQLAQLMVRGDRGVDFITIDGGEGGTGAGPLAFTDHVALPFKLGFTSVFRIFARHGLHDAVVWIGSGKLGFPVPALLAINLGCDMVNVAREAMLSVGCIQAQRCHTDRCPTGVATQNRWLSRGLDPTLKSVRAANYLMNLRKNLLELAHACGVVHPSLVRGEQIAILDDRFGVAPARELFGYEPFWEIPYTGAQQAIWEIVEPDADQG